MLSYYDKLKRDHHADLKLCTIDLANQYIYAKSFGFKCHADTAMKKLKESLAALFVLNNYDMYSESVTILGN